MYWRWSVTGIEVAIASAAAISKVVISHGHCIYTCTMTSQEIRFPARALSDTQDLTDKDKKMYTESGMLHILSRNMRIKERPEKFQVWSLTSLYSVQLRVQYLMEFR